MFFVMLRAIELMKWQIMWLMVSNVVCMLLACCDVVCTVVCPVANMLLVSSPSVVLVSSPSVVQKLRLHVACKFTFGGAKIGFACCL